jgi:murein endopeptidase
MRLPTAIALVALLCAGIAALARGSELREVPAEEIAWRDSTPIGLPNRGALINGVQLPPEGPDFFTWDPIFEISPNRDWRRWASDSTLRTLLGVLAAYRAANPGAPRVGIGDLSRPEGGPFGRRFGGLGHASHQNGLDIDLYYPRDDGLELAPDSVAQINRGLSADLLARFVDAGAVYVFVGPGTKLRAGPKRVVQKLVHHDDHMHIRFSARRGGRTG